MSVTSRVEQQQRLARRSSMHAGMKINGSGEAAASTSSVPPIRLPEFLLNGGHIPATVTARGYQPGDPVAFEPQPTAPRPATKDSDSNSNGNRASLGRRSTMPLAGVLQRVVQPPPLLHAALTPSCDMCSDEGADNATHPSQVWCAECDLWLCGSEEPHDGLPTDSAPVPPAPAPAAHNWRLHRHTVMQGHVRVAATAAMQLNKLEAAEASKPAEQRRSKKELALSLYALPMRGIVWECQSLADEDDWLEYDLLTQRTLEKAFKSSAHSHDHYHQQHVQISDQYEVHVNSDATAAATAAAAAAAGKKTASHSSPPHAFYQLNRLSQRRSGVRRVELSKNTLSLLDLFGGGVGGSGTGTRPNTRPSSAVPTPRASAATSPSNGRTAPPEWRSHTNANGAVPTLTLPLPNGAGTARPASASARSPSSSSLTPRASARPVLSRHGSMDALQMLSIAEWGEGQWENFARSQRAPVQGHGQGQGGNDEPVASLFPLFDGERGDALLLAVYHNALSAVSILLGAGFSPRGSYSSWTRLDALQLACMQGNDGVASLLLQHGADPSYRNSTATTMCTEYAAKSGCLPLLQRVLRLRRERKALAHSDVLLRDARRKAKRNTWVDIAESEADADQDQEAAAAADGGATKVAGRLAPPGATGSSSSSSSSSSGPAAIDPDLNLFPHLLTEALNVPPVLAHTLEVPRFLLEEMLRRAEAAPSPADAPAFELARMHAWMSTCVSSSSVERLRFLLGGWARYTGVLAKLRRVSDDLRENLTHPQYARAVLDFQPSLDALLIQACNEHPASEWEPEEDEEDQDDEGEGGDSDVESATSSSFSSSSSSSSTGSFALLSLLIDEHNADVNFVLRDATDGTDLSPLLMAIRDRKMHLVVYLVEHGADVQRRLRCVEVDLLADADLNEMSQAPVERAPSPDGRAFEMLLPLEYAREECAYDADEVRTLEQCIARGLARRHRKAEKLVRVVLDVSRQMAGQHVGPAQHDDDDADGSFAAHSVASPPPVPLSPTTPAVRIDAPFGPRVLHIISSYCFGPRTLTAGATISAATGHTLSRPSSPQASP